MPRTLNGVTSAFAPRLWGGHLLALLLVAATLALGWWQYSAYQAQRAAESRDLTHAAAKPLTSVMGGNDPFPGNEVGQPITATGTWVGGGTVFVSGREHGGREGYWVVTPLAIGTPDGSALPIVRGWVASLADAPPPPSGTATVQGWLQPTDGTGEVDTDRSDDVIPQVRTADLIQHVDQDLYDAYAVLDLSAVRADGEPDDARGLVQADLAELPPPAGGTGLRNLLYAIEWVFFAAFVGYVWWRWVQERIQEVSTVAA
ncbi:SURF1 family protein [Nocardioides acrostichi]|uniref:SURF1-like protein n=1 Tax=Nocardioides acrostichi TaxID=2784339 RepID=A0A930YCX6_9ACTN|nr:SURF1 family protein [Nocardioides acrostichi]MBF4163958.1 SURF1 family protein [Nocardioides acrostichi]